MKFLWAGPDPPEKRGLMHRPSSLSPDNVLRFLQLTPNGANFEGILRGLKLRKFERRPLGKIVAKLKKKKVIVELPGGRLMLAGAQPGRKVETALRAETPGGAPDGERTRAG